MRGVKAAKQAKGDKRLIYQNDSRKQRLVISRPVKFLDVCRMSALQGCTVRKARAAGIWPAGSARPRTGQRQAPLTPDLQSTRVRAPSALLHRRTAANKLSLLGERIERHPTSVVRPFLFGRLFESELASSQVVVVTNRRCLDARMRQYPTQDPAAAPCRQNRHQSPSVPAPCRLQGYWAEDRKHSCLDRRIADHRR